MVRRRPLTISLEPKHRAVLEQLANDHYDGNLSAVVRQLIETHPVTKSMLPSSALAT